MGKLGLCRALVAALALLAAVVVKGQDPADITNNVSEEVKEEFREYLRTFNKRYPTATEFSHRLTNFVRSKAEIEQINAR
jgi:hypothetical protein